MESPSFFSHYHTSEACSRLKEIACSIERVTVRSWDQTDYDQIRSFAGNLSSFTVPSDYVLDALANSEPELNLVAESADGKTLGYVLTMRSHPHELLIWQLAKDRRSSEISRIAGVGMQKLIRQFKGAIERSDIRAFQFTIRSDQVKRWAHKMAREVFDSELRALPFKIDGEKAYEIRLDQIVPLTLAEVYSIPNFPEFVRRVFSADRISPDWLRNIQRFGPRDLILEIGAGDGRLTSDLLRTGASVVAVEPNTSFNPADGVRQRGGREEALRIIRGYFPNIPKERYSSIILHQNVFLEIANQIDERDLLAEFKNFLTPDGKILFDYISEPDPGKPHVPTTVFEGLIPGFGDIHYEREFIETHWGMRYETLLRFSLKQGNNLETHLRHVEVRLSPLDALCRKISALGGHAEVEDINAFTFFPGKAKLVKASFIN